MPATVHECIALARARLVQAGSRPGDAALDAEVLARHLLGWDAARLLAHGRDAASPAFVRRFDEAVARRAAHEPVAYITGGREFWGLEFAVSRDVLIPRPETELIIESALQAVGRDRCRRIADIGTGSGCLAVALATEFGDASVVAVDASAAALKVAAENARRHHIRERIHFLQGNFLDALRGSFDLLVSNPPYVPAGAELPPEVARFEPPAALRAGHDGLDALRRLIADAPARLADGGAFIVEFGFGQADAVRALAREAGWTGVELRADLRGIPRVAVLAA